MKFNNALRILFSLILIINCCKISANSNSEQFFLKGYIQTGSNIKNAPEFRILFGGRQVISDDSGFYTFSVDRKLNEFNFLICKDIKQVFKKVNTVKGLVLKKNKDYKYYFFKKTEDGNRWILQEQELGNKISKNTVIVLMNPKYVESVESWNINLDFKFMNLPKIVLNDEISKARLSRGSAKSLLRSLDKTVFHEKVLTQVKNFPNKIKAIITQ
jgi:hypothetical protein